MGVSLLRICIDGLGLSQLHGTSLYGYTYELLNKLIEDYPQPNYSILWDNTPFPSELYKNPKLKYINLEINRHLNDYSHLENFLKRDRIDIFHSTNNGFSLPKNKSCKTISTINTLFPLSFKDKVDTKFYDKFMTNLPIALEMSDKIIVESDFLKNDLEKNLNIDESKINVISPFISSIFKPKSSKITKEVLRNKFDINFDYILFAGSIHPRKNIDKLITVFSNIRKSQPSLKLLIVGNICGKRTDCYLDLKSLVNKLNIQDSVIFTNTIYYKDMPYIYNGARCFLNLSDYEGFPMSSIEAINCGCPVICSKNSSFIEFLDGNAFLVDNNNLALIENLLLHTLSTPNFSKDLLSKTFLIKRSHIRELIRLYESLYMS